MRERPGKAVLVGSPPKTERLLSLLHAQRREVEVRGGLARGSPGWQESSERLDEINLRIVHLVDFGTERPDPIGLGLNVVLESRPEDDLAFRSSVVSSVRAAVLAQTTDRLSTRSLELLASSEERIRRTARLVGAAQAALRTGYPDATIEAADDPEEPEIIRLLADREGRVA
jgi:hypothetical protein